MTGMAAAAETVGWTLVLVLLQTLFLALVVGAWTRTGTRRAPARHHAAFAALLGAVALGIVMWATLRYALVPGQTPAVPVTVAVAGPDSGPERPADPGGRAGVAAAAAEVVSGPRVSRLLGWIAAVWAVVAVLLGLRLAGGLVLVCRIRRRASPVELQLVETFQRLAAHRGVARRLDLLESADVDGPVTMGWRRPTVLLPLGFARRLPQAFLPPILAHEIEHARRNDPLKASVQAATDALLFFSPGARWLSRLARVAREEICDDAALAACGDRALYAHALGALAGASPVRAAAVLGFGAPKLSDRIRRVLRGGDEMQGLSRTHRLLLALGLGATALAALVVVPAATRATAAVRAESRRDASGLASQAADSGGCPLGWLMYQPGAPITITRVARGRGSDPSRVHVRNLSEDSLVSVTFAAVIERPLEAPTTPVEIVKTPPIALSLAPGGAADIDLPLPPLGLCRRPAPAPDPNGVSPSMAQVMLAVAAAEGANWLVWTVHPDASASSAGRAFHVPEPWVSRELVDAPPPGRLAGNVCLDDLGRPTSLGGLVPVRGGPPHWARCGEGHVWRAHEARLPPAGHLGERAVP